MHLLSVLSLAMLVGSSGVWAATKSPAEMLSDSKIKKLIIQESIDSYPGNCPCPYNTARNGSSCGRRSAWSRAGGYAPICYDKEVTKEMIQQWRQQNPAQP